MPPPFFVNLSELNKPNFFLATFEESHRSKLLIAAGLVQIDSIYLKFPIFLICLHIISRFVIWHQICCRDHILIGNDDIFQLLLEFSV